MTLSVGVLYDAVDFLKLVRESSLTKNEFKNSFPTVRVASGQQVLDLAQRVNWIRLSEDGVLELTNSGIVIEACKSPIETLRMQLKDFVFSVRPPWASLIPKGRTETLKYLDSDVAQCFREAGLLSSIDDNVIQWWDTLAKVARGREIDTSVHLGRAGERLSLAFELERTNSTPAWQSVESNLAGYDLLSRVSQTDSSRLRIEVKASGNTVSYATLHLSRNEWNVACSEGNHVFHLWLLDPSPQLRILEQEEIGCHVPRDVGEGEWESVEIPFTVFSHIPPIEFTR